MVDNGFRVRDVTGLRVVGASVSPDTRFFIVSAVYMFGEKAADVILANAMNSRI